MGLAPAPTELNGGVANDFQTCFTQEPVINITTFATCFFETWMSDITSAV